MALPDYRYVEGWDHYWPICENGTAPNIITTLGATYTLVGSIACYIRTALSHTGASLYFVPTGTNQTSFFVKGLPTNYARSIGTITFNVTAFGNGNDRVGVCFRDGTTTQISISLNNGGAIQVYRSAVSGGTHIATSIELVTLASINTLSWDVTFHQTLGIIKVWLNGNLTTINLTNQDTCNSANQYCNQFAYYGANYSGCSWTVDHCYADFYLASGGSEVPHLGPVVNTDEIEVETQSDFVAFAGIIGNDAYKTTATNAPGAGYLALIPVTPEANCTLDSLAILPRATAAAAKHQAVLYTDSSGSPNTLVATGTEVTGTVSGATLALPFSSGQALVGGTQYWIGYITDTSVVLQRYDTTSTNGQKKVNTYASGAPATATGMTAAQPFWMIYGNVSAVAANKPQVNYDRSSAGRYNTSATPGDRDMGDFPALTITPEEIHSLTLTVHTSKSDAGARTINLVAQSGGLESLGSNSGVSPSVSIASIDSNLFTDPNTGLAWTPGGCNAMKGGYEIAS